MAETDTAQRIAAAALAVLESEGQEAVSMRRIASAVGITPMAIYHHFPNRGALLAEITDQEFERLAGILDAASTGGSATAQILRLVDCYVTYAFEQPRVFDFVFSQKRDEARRFPDDFRAGHSPTMNRLSGIVAEGMRSGQLKKDDVWEVALEIWAHIHGYLALYRAGRFQLSEEEFRQLCRRSLRRLFHGLTP